MYILQQADKAYRFHEEKWPILKKTVGLWTWDDKQKISIDQCLVFEKIGEESIRKPWNAGEIEKLIFFSDLVLLSESQNPQKKIFA